jgi:hypothetical protein
MSSSSTMRRITATNKSLATPTRSDRGGGPRRGKKERRGGPAVDQRHQGSRPEGQPPRGL